MRISDWSSDVCSSDLEAVDRLAVDVGADVVEVGARHVVGVAGRGGRRIPSLARVDLDHGAGSGQLRARGHVEHAVGTDGDAVREHDLVLQAHLAGAVGADLGDPRRWARRSGGGPGGERCVWTCGMWWTAVT